MVAMQTMMVFVQMQIVTTTIQTYQLLLERLVTMAIQTRRMIPFKRMDVAVQERQLQFVIMLILVEK